MKKKHSLLAVVATTSALALGFGVLPASAATTTWAFPGGTLSCDGLYVAMSATTTYTAKYYRNNILDASYPGTGVGAYHRNLKRHSITSAAITSEGSLPSTSGPSVACAFS